MRKNRKRLLAGLLCAVVLMACLLYTSDAADD